LESRKVSAILYKQVARIASMSRVKKRRDTTGTAGDGPIGEI
jgi:hypothetical protein